MRVPRRFCLLAVTVVLFCPCVTADIPLHENFEQADTDFYAVVAFLTDAKMLCEDALKYSLLINFTILFNQTLAIRYSQENVNDSAVKSDALENKISYSVGILESIKDNAGSYYYLKDVLLPMKDLGFNVSSFVWYHQEFIANLTKIVRAINEGNNTKVMMTFNDAKSLLYLCDISTQKVITNLNTINQSFSIDALRKIIVNLDQMLERYDTYLSILLDQYISKEPFLSIYVTKEDVYFDEEIQIYGFFIADGKFVIQHPLSIYFDDKSMNKTYTNSNGKFDYTLVDLMPYSYGEYKISASTTYNHTNRYSNTISVTIHKIPTKILLLSPSIQYYLNEPMPFSGKLLDYKNRGLVANFSLYFKEINYSIKSAENGDFSYVVNEALPFGNYPVYASFNSGTIYESSKSNVIIVQISTPTIITIYSAKNRFFIGDNIQLNGTLTSKINGASLSGRSIEIFSNNEKIGAALTNNTGAYNFTYVPKNLQEIEYTIFVVFYSKDAEWSSSTSSNIIISILPPSSESVVRSQYIAIFIIVPIILILIVLVYLFRKRWRPLRSKRESTHIGIALPKHSFESICFDEKDFFLDFSSRKKSDFKSMIVLRYGALLHFLSTQGMTLVPSSTHLDIENKMLKKGLPKKAIENVTKTFERAMYSPRPLDEEDVTMFTINMLKILKNILGKDRWNKVLHAYIDS